MKNLILPLVLSMVLFSIAIADHTDDHEEMDDDDDAEIDLTFIAPEAFGLPSKEAGKRVAAWTPSMNYPPYLLSGYYQGDILFPPHAPGKSGILVKSYRWKNRKVYYDISCNNFTNMEKALVLKAINTIEKYTCVRFEKRVKQRNFINITCEPTGCFSSVGMIGGAQQLNLQRPGCVYLVSTPIHELMHALGILHEQSRSDRDDYVTINWENIIAGMERNFDKEPKKYFSTFNIPYAYKSVMHYPGTAFSKNGKPTIEAKTGKQLDYPKEITSTDIALINEMYCKRDCRKDLKRGIIAYLADQIMKCPLGICTKIAGMLKSIEGVISGKSI